METAMLEVISDLSREFGTADHVLGGGGNTSVKDGDTLWVKPSGCTLAEMAPARFVAIHRPAIDALFETALPEASGARESAVKDAMAAAVTGGSGGRPSVEAPLHHILPGRYVVHTHPPLVNGLTCGRDGEAACARLFPGALWLPYTDPGFILCQQVRRALAVYRETHGHAPPCVMLQNHGVFVHGDQASDIQRTYAELGATLLEEYARRGVATRLHEGPPPSDRDRTKVLSAMRTVMTSVLADAVAAAGAFPLFKGPLTPDHVVCAGAYPCLGTRREDVLAFRGQHGRFPRVLGGHQAVFGIGGTAASADLALALARDAARVEQLAAAFGGAHYLDDRARRFIEDWEVEAYRRQVMTGSTP